MAIAVSVSEPMLLAGGGGGGHAPGPVFLALCLIPLVGVFGALGTLAWIRRHREAPLRSELQARPVTFRSRVRVNAELFGMMASLHGNLHLNVHGDAFEIVDNMPVSKFVFGMDYCYRAQFTNVQVIRLGRSECIEITGYPGSTAVRVRVWGCDANRQVWDALVAAGAQPVGQPPQS